ncbi:MAG: M23 family metallopeptidase [Clostridiales bacterium]|nr:M23 family metallopeptidase [Clostridiales bacterium]
MVRHKSLLMSIANVAAPIVAVVVLGSTIHFWMNQNFGLVLAYGNETIATIQSEQTLEQASDMVNQRLVSDAVEKKAGVGISPRYQLTIVDKAHYATPTALCDKLIKKSGGIIEDASGLYVNGELIGAIKSSADLSYLLQNTLSSAKGDDPAAKVSFVENVESVKGLYPTASLLTSEELKNLLAGTSEESLTYTVKEGDTAEVIADQFQVSKEELTESLGEAQLAGLKVGDQIRLSEAKPLLTVKMTREERYETIIPYKTVTVNDDHKDTDYSKVTQEGVEGIEQCVDEVTYIDGVEVSRETVSKTVVKEAVDKIITVGTQKVEKPVNQEGIATGSMAWPVPYTRRVVSQYSMRWGKMHNGIDISSSGIRGQSIVAADGGTVKYVKYHNYGYGYHLMIDHGNGLSTLYAHCNSIYVKAGQKVSKGQVIATVGTTGDSTGNHLHFEVYRNGSRVNPLNYIG